jgi:hypothetical protein
MRVQTGGETDVQLVARLSGREEYDAHRDNPNTKGTLMHLTGCDGLFAY